MGRRKYRQTKKKPSPGGKTHRTSQDSTYKPSKKVHRSVTLTPNQEESSQSFKNTTINHNVHQPIGQNKPN